MRPPIYTALLLSLALLGTTTKAQSLLGNNPVLPQIHATALEWADFDGDGDQDLFAAGLDSLGVRHSYLFRNNNGTTFVQVAIPIPGLGQAAATWADLDGDNDPDLVVSGDSARLSPISRWCRNNGGVLTAEPLAMPGQMLGEITAGDFDGDGDRDLIFIGWNPRLLGTTVILRNNGIGQFTEVQGSGIQGLVEAVANAGDADGDGDQDILATGIDGNDQPTAFLMRNMGGMAWSSTSLGLRGAFRGNLAWADFDLDGDLDILQVGFSPNKNCILYRRQPTGYVPISVPFPKLGRAFAAWCNFDPLQDNLPDVALCGESDNGLVLRVYHNLGNGFVDVQPGIPLPGLMDPRIAWADWNGDDYLDFAVSGRTSNGQPRLFLVRYDQTLQRFVP